MRAVVTGQIGVDKKPFLEKVADAAGQRGENIGLFNVGNMMYREAPDVRPGRILDLPISRLASLRRAAFKDIIAATRPVDEHRNVMVNTHATFRWHHGLFSAFDFDQIRAIAPDLFICLVDNVEVVHQRLHRDHIVDVTPPGHQAFSFPTMKPIETKGSDAVGCEFSVDAFRAIQVEASLIGAEFDGDCRRCVYRTNSHTMELYNQRAQDGERGKTRRL